MVLCDLFVLSHGTPLIIGTVLFLVGGASLSFLLAVRFRRELAGSVDRAVKIMRIPAFQYMIAIAVTLGLVTMVHNRSPELTPIVIALVVVVGLVIVHLRPLSEREVRQLASKRRQREINAHFRANHYERRVDTEFKRKMNPDGRFYHVHEALSDFPSLAAALLKWKKHEWVIIAWEKDRVVGLIFTNKGYDDSSVSPHISERQIIQRAKDGGFQSLLLFHNHPNPNPTSLDCSIASDVDLEFFKNCALEFNSSGLNFVGFVCERGQAYRKILSLSDSFKPLGGFVRTINKRNKTSRLANLLLHVERLL